MPMLHPVRCWTSVNALRVATIAPHATVTRDERLRETNAVPQKSRATAAFVFIVISPPRPVNTGWFQIHPARTTTAMPMMSRPHTDEIRCAIASLRGSGCGSHSTAVAGVYVTRERIVACPARSRVAVTRQLSYDSAQRSRRTGDRTEGAHAHPPSIACDVY